jgi:hypothetical protein
MTVDKLFCLFRAAGLTAIDLEPPASRLACNAICLDLRVPLPFDQAALDRHQPFNDAVR